MNLSTHDINPRLLRCAYFNGYETKENVKMSKRICYDYEIEYYINSNGGIMVDGKYLPFQAGEINIRKPGQVVCGIAPYECYIICIDMKGNALKKDDYSFGTEENAQPRYQNALLQLLPNRFIPSQKEIILSTIRELIVVSQNKSDLDIMHVNLLLYQLLFEIFRQCDVNSKQRFTNVSVQKAIEYIRNHYCEDLCIQDMITQLGLSKAYFHRCFKNATKTTPVQMIQTLRIEKAKTLLCFTQNSISEVAGLCGFYDSVYFSAVFKKMTGVTPTEYRNQSIRQSLS